MLNEIDFSIENHILPGYESSYYTVSIFQFFAVSTLRLVQFGWVVERINSKSAKVQNALIKELKFIVLRTFWTVHIIAKLIKCQWLLYFVPSWHSSVKLPIVPLASFSEFTDSTSCTHLRTRPLTILLQHCMFTMAMNNEQESQQYLNQFVIL